MYCEIEVYGHEADMLVCNLIKFKVFYCVLWIILEHYFKWVNKNDAILCVYFAGPCVSILCS